ncbi:MAG: type II secretion system protein [Rhodocyclaceae bacterium]|nr:MAG: type II secretion system protein [Rhodocyclaceae bacterium]
MRLGGLRRLQGFTIVELLVTLVIVGILASSVIPLAEVAVQRGREQELRESLRTMRKAIDAYKQAVDDGRIERKADEAGYPHSLDELVKGVPDAKNPKNGTLRFLRQIPRDPMKDDSGAGNAKAWGLRCYDSSHEEPKAGKDVFDVYSLAAGDGLNGVPYKDW